MNAVVLQGGVGHGLSAAGAYRFGLADGMAGQRDDHRTFALFEAHYTHGYAQGAATLPTVKAAPPAEFVEVPSSALGVPVCVPSQGIHGVISGRSTCDRPRWRVTYFNRHFWRVEHRWFARSQFEVVQTSLPGAANCATDESAAQPA